MIALLNCTWQDITLILLCIYLSVAARVAEKKICKVMGHQVEVTLFTGSIEDDVSDDPTSLISDNILILDNVPSNMNDDILMLYIDNITQLDGEQNDYSIDHNNTEVVITFNTALDTDEFPAGTYNTYSPNLQKPTTILQA